MKLNAAKLLAGLVLSIVMFFSFSTMAQSVKDIDGNNYVTVKYGLQEWIAGNLNVSSFRNGDVIKEAKTNEEWSKAGTEGKPAWCYFNNDLENGKIYGKLYNWYAINDPRGLAPEGWSIPENNHWMKLVKNLLGVDVAGIKLKNTTGWKSKNGTNNIGFAALPGGYRNESGEYNELGTKSQWWANSEPVEFKKSNLIYSLMLNDYTEQVSYIKATKESGLSVRCVKDMIRK